jgi:thiamine kinase-like enzyme
MEKYSLLLMLLTICSCDIKRVLKPDEKSVEDFIKNKLSITENITVEKLSGGFSGAQLFKASTGSKKYVVRFLTHKSLEERTLEINTLQIASQEGYGPNVYYSDIDQGVVIMEFLQQSNISQELFKSDKTYVLLAKLLQKIHRGPKFKNIPDRDVFNTIHQLSHDKKLTCNKALPLEKIENIINFIYKTLSPHLISAPCHNDLHPSNIIFLGDKFKAIDYERATQSDPYFDIAMVAYAYCQNSHYENVLLSTYLERQPTEIENSKLYLFKQVAWAYCGICFLIMIPELLTQYEKTNVLEYNELIKTFIDLSKQKNKLKFAKALLNHVIQNFESKEFNNTVKILNKK